MDPVLITMVSLLVAGIAGAFYMDWLGLWVSKAEMQVQINRSKERRQEAEKADAGQGPR